jgi:hypothetical protein
MANLGQKRGVGLQPPLAADEHHTAAALLRAVHRELEEEGCLPAIFATNGKRRRMSKEYYDFNHGLRCSACAKELIRVRQKVRMGCVPARRTRKEGDSRVLMQRWGG